MKVKKLRELIAKHADSDDIFFEVELGKQGSWQDGRAYMDLGSLRFVDRFDEGDSHILQYSFKGKLETF